LYNPYKQVEAEANYEEAVSSSTAQKYLNWVSRMIVYWSRRDRWCLTWQHTGDNMLTARVKSLYDC